MNEKENLQLMLDFYKVLLQKEKTGEIAFNKIDSEENGKLDYFNCK